MVGATLLGLGVGSWNPDVTRSLNIGINGLQNALQSVMSLSFESWWPIGASDSKLKWPGGQITWSWGNVPVLKTS